eukprot:3156174-Rhodomonas_salina.1
MRNADVMFEGAPPPTLTTRTHTLSCYPRACLAAGEELSAALPVAGSDVCGQLSSLARQWSTRFRALKPAPSALADECK